MNREPQHFSVRQLLERAREMGLDVNERTLKFYTNRGLLPKPVRNPYPGADGRVSYYPRDALRRLRKIYQMKAQGFKLGQIRQLLERQGNEPLRQLTGPQEEDWRREVVFRYLHSFGSDEARQARTEFMAAVSGTDADEFLQKAGRTYLERTLAPLVGKAEAHRYVEEYFLGIAPAELERKLDVFRRWRQQAAQPTDQAPVSAYLAIRRLTGNLLLKLVPRTEYRRQLKAVAKAFRETQPFPSEGSDDFLLSQALRARQLVSQALGALEAASEGPDAGALAAALEQLQRGHFLLTQVASVARANLAMLEL